LLLIEANPENGDLLLKPGSEISDIGSTLVPTDPMSYLMMVDTAENNLWHGEPFFEAFAFQLIL
jgi:hypothetical protein